MNTEQIVILVTGLLGVFAFLGILYDAWSAMRNAGTNSGLKHEIKKSLITNLIFGSIVLFLSIGLEVWIFSAIN